MAIKLAIFDCDGTIVDSQANIYKAMDDAFILNDLEPPKRTDVRNIVGLSLTEAIQKLRPSAPVDDCRKMAEDYKICFQKLRQNGGLDHEPLYEGLAALLKKLSERNILMAVATGKSDRGLALCLDHHYIAEYFVSLQTADRHPSKPHPSMITHILDETGIAAHEAVMIGDTSYDMAMAQNAGVKAIGVNWGYHDVETLRQYGAAIIAHDMDALFDAIMA